MIGSRYPQPSPERIPSDKMSPLLLSMLRSRVETIVPQRGNPVICLGAGLFSSYWKSILSAILSSGHFGLQSQSLDRHCYVNAVDAMTS